MDTVPRSNLTRLICCFSLNPSSDLTLKLCNSKSNLSWKQNSTPAPATAKTTLPKVIHVENEAESYIHSHAFSGILICTPDSVPLPPLNFGTRRFDFRLLYVAMYFTGELHVYDRQADNSLNLRNVSEYLLKFSIYFMQDEIWTSLIMCSFQFYMTTVNRWSCQPFYTVFSFVWFMWVWWNRNTGKPLIKVAP